MGTRERVLYVENLLDQAMRLVEGGMHAHLATDAVLQGLDLEMLFISDGAAVTRMFRDGFLERLNRMDSPSRGFVADEELVVAGPRSIRITRVEEEGSPPMPVRVRLLDSRYSVSRGNILVRYMTKDDLIEVGSDLIKKGDGMVRKGTVLAIDMVAALKKYSAEFPEELPENVLARLESKFSGEELLSNGGT